MMQGTRLQAIEDPPELIGQERPELPPSRAQSALTGLLITSLKALSQRFIVALASLVDLAMIASVFALCLLVISNPTTLQLIEGAGYAVFVLVAIAMRRT